MLRRKQSLPRTLVYAMSTIAASALLVAGCGNSSQPAQADSGGTSSIPSSSSADASSSNASTESNTSATGAGDTSTGDAVGKLLENAKAEGTLTLYTVATEASAQKQIDAFTQKYGVKVELVRLTGAQMNQRFNAESHSSAGLQADVVVSEDLPMLKAGIGDGTLVPMPQADVPGYPGDLPEQFQLSDVGTPTILIMQSSIAYNTDSVKKEDAPKTWADLLDPKWKGKIGIASLGSAAAYSGEWTQIAKMVGDDFLAKLGQQDLKTYAAGATLAAAVGSGEIEIAANSLVTNTVPTITQGAPVAYVVPEIDSGINVSIAVAAKAAHPAAARLFAMYAMSSEGAAVLANEAHSLSPFDTANLPGKYVAADMATAPDDVPNVQKLLNVE